MTADQHPTRGRSRSEEKRLQIFEAAAKLFTEQGFAGTSMDQVAEAAGVSKQTVYSHFGSKEELFVAAVQQKCIVNSLDPGLFNNGLPVPTLLLELARHFTDLLLSEEAVRVLRVCTAQAETHPEMSRLFYGAGPQNLMDLLTRYLDEQVRAGTLAIDDTRYACWQFLFMVKGDFAFRAQLGLELNQTPQQIEDYLRSCVDMFLRAYAVKQAPAEHE